MLKRESLRDQIREEIRSQIVNGVFSAGQNLNEANLASELGVSRTPLREALVALQHEGFIEASPGKGFSVLTLSHEEYKSIVPIIGALEKIALLSSPFPTTEQIRELRDINKEFIKTDNFTESEKKIAERLRLDLLWHELLLERSSNSKALAMLHNLKLQWRRYEYTFFSVLGSVEESARVHDLVLDELAKRNLKKAALHLEAQWNQCCSLSDFLRNKEQK